MWDQWCSACAETVRAAQEAGELRADVDPDTVGAWLVGAYEGAVIHAKLIRDRRPLDDFMAITFDGPVPFIVALA